MPIIPLNNFFIIKIFDGVIKKKNLDYIFFFYFYIVGVIEIDNHS